MDRGEESFIRWRALNDRDDYSDGDDDGAYFELELHPHPHPQSHSSINIIDAELELELELVDVPFPGFQAAIIEKQKQQQQHVQINSRWGPWGVVHARNKESLSSAKRMTTVKVRAINIITISAASLERWFANLMMAFRLRSRKHKMMKIMPRPHHHSIIINASPPPPLPHHSSLLHAAIAHCNSS